MFDFMQIKNGVKHEFIFHKDSYSSKYKSEKERIDLFHKKLITNVSFTLEKAKYRLKNSVLMHHQG